MRNRATDRIRRCGLLSLVLLLHCGVPAQPTTGTERQAILEGELVDAQDTPVLLLSSPEGKCTSTLVAPNLALTARHCIASQISGGFTCTAAGELVATGTGAGSIGDDDPASNLRFFTPPRAAEVLSRGAIPDAIGVRVLSTKTPSACRDDLAFVVLDRELSQLAPMPLRLQTPSTIGEGLSIWGYGLTENVQDPIALRTRRDAVLFAIGPDVPPTDTQPAPVRAIRTSPVTCAGDSGGPIVSIGTGEIVAVVSVGSNSGAGGPVCSNNELAQTVGPRIAAYPTLVNDAFAAAASALAPNPDGSAEAAAAGGDSSSRVEDSTAAGEGSPDSEIRPDSRGGDDDALATQDVLSTPDGSLDGSDKGTDPNSHHVDDGCSVSHARGDTPRTRTRLGVLCLVFTWMILRSPRRRFARARECARQA